MYQVDEPLVPRPTEYAAYDSALIIPASSLTHTPAASLLFYEARRERHNHRFRAHPSNAGRLGVASWPFGRLVGLRAFSPAGTDAVGCVTTHEIVVPPHASRLLVDLDASQPGAECTVVLSAVGASRMLGEPIAGANSNATIVQWRMRAGAATPPGTELEPVRGTAIALTFHLMGPAELFGFQLV